MFFHLMSATSLDYIPKKTQQPFNSTQVFELVLLLSQYSDAFIVMYITNVLNYTVIAGRLFSACMVLK